MGTIGRLTEVDVRELWKHEQHDFSNWLAKEENLEYLNEILGLTLVNVDKEVYVGPYRCDLVAKDEVSDTVVIIENQLESTNHDHLGKIITYASGLGATVIVWIVRDAKEEHRAAIEWLNNNTVDTINFFLIEIHAYRIGGSEPAPKFEIIEQPNGFVKQGVRSKAEGETLSKSESERLVFWEQFRQAVIDRGRPFNPAKPSADSWCTIAVGSSQANISIDLVNKDSLIVVSFNSGNKDLFDGLQRHRKEIEAELGFPLEWNRMDNKKTSRIKYFIPGLNFDDHSNYTALIEQVIDLVVKMRRVFREYL